MASVKEFQVAFDCAEPERVARFDARCWGTSNHRRRRGLQRGPTLIARCRLTLRVRGSHALIPRAWARDCFSSAFPKGKVVKNRLHLDVRVGTGLVREERLATLEAECARLVALGAVRVRLLPADDDREPCIVMQDVEGNEFCLDRWRQHHGQAVMVEPPAKTIYSGGQNGVDSDGKVVGPTLGEQARQAFRNLATIVESEGASLANIAHWRIAIVDKSTPWRGVTRGLLMSRDRSRAIRA
jgi:enamine deaminase RidA (YjgF/YER057c/UK114 family)